MPIPDGVKEMFEESTKSMDGFATRLDTVIDLLTEIRDQGVLAASQG